jgi:hypothetical protein
MTGQLQYLFAINIFTYTSKGIQNAFATLAGESGNRVIDRFSIVKRLRRKREKDQIRDAVCNRVNDLFASQMGCNATPAKPVVSIDVFGARGQTLIARVSTGTCTKHRKSRGAIPPGKVSVPI